jgi:peptidoglycan/xylan/chitin deacetylase (PgdA/CDA1 family)
VTAAGALRAAREQWPEVTLANLPWVITELKKQGVEFVTFSELAKQLPR